MEKFLDVEHEKELSKEIIKAYIDKVKFIANDELKEKYGWLRSKSNVI